MKKINSLLLALFIGLTTAIAQSPLNSLDFDGIDDYASSALPNVFNDITNNDFTIETWIKPNGNNFSRVIFAQQNSTNFATISLSASNNIYFYVSNTSQFTLSSLPLGVWSHVACTWDASTSLIEIYINGVLESTANGGGSSTGNDNIMTIGARTNAAQFFQGELDEVRIWDIIRTQCQISSAMSSEFTASQLNLVAYYNFNQGIAGGTNTGIITLPDFTTNYNGNLLNFNLSGSSSNWVSSGAGINTLNQNNNYVSGTDTRTECNSYTWIDGINYTASNNSATFNIANGAANGCDSLVTLDLTINNVSDITTSISSTTISANNTVATYQWLDCDDLNSVIIGETGQSYTATVNGNYAVELTENGCVDTTTCVSITTVGVEENSFGNEFKIYPNPSDGNFGINLGGSYQNVQILITDISGKVIQSKNITKAQNMNLSITNPAGIYIVSINAGNKNAIIRLVKE
ncbi:T9SS type A sorting domain-containing protein [Crocinitomicaceae bacterium]|nr:T9SS type A sorting domain-containing protein [Crocinitomicaceae bacterium]